ncbi:pyridoxamine 5'-phosphate oxidase family protein [Dubosiella newyorkensis]|jgi:nitroimidazol reductase NimA-like FMN-containing flavoprotein (pyridoxamine 5'-phosphate oxidase superfamily)|uniref:pyridoxamine 5'-phosphate oxidase family protein n=1 Tax=Dubosiella newyorkensis TaxID=1862672 RepID=UPI002357F564|nr:pyridoxamine 5'-phosphate oxidase family protein [Dubosiella newyorkensis]MCI9040302.1 pyridoxamine 5'-phosphate oxidase family protein [Dubosiella newyorkensis]
MYHSMRRSRQQLSEQETIKILENATSGVLALFDADDYTYALPISYVYHGNEIYFHSASSGHKIEAIKHHQKVSFCVVAQDKIVPEKFTTFFKSAIVFGTIEIIEDEAEKRKAIECLSKKYSPHETEERTQQEIDRFWKQLTMLKLNIEKISGKQSIELV